MSLIPVKGDLLKWARDFRGLTEKQAADLLGITVAELRKYENDDIKPTLGMFEVFASRYRVPQSTLFREARPDIQPAPKDYRTLAGMKPKQSFDFKIALSNVRELIFHIERIARDDDEFVAPTIPHIRLSADPFVAGEKERKRIGVDIREQLDWATKDAFRKWRVAVENTGIFVFQQKFPLGDCRGFTLFDTDMAPVIVVNKDETFDVAKVFTLIHEMCHLLLRAPGIPSYNERDPLEAFCNKFTAAFFMPLDALRAVLPYWPNEPVNWKRDEIASWARRLKVSQMALALRLEQLGLATSGFHRKFEYKGKTAAIPHQGGPPRVVVRMSEIGVSYSKVVIDALNRQAINEVEAVEALGLGPGHLDAVKASLTRVRRQAVLG